MVASFYLNVGAYSRLSEAGCVPICCPCEAVVGKVSLKVQELRIECETKTKDNVFITIFISVQYQAIRDKVNIILIIKFKFFNC